MKNYSYTLKARFEKNTNRHKGLEWRKVQEKQEGKAEKLWSLNEMERTGGEPDVVGHDNEAKFLDPVQRHAWRRWKFDWLTPKKRGQYTLLARAKDAKGGVQPDKHDQNYDTYVILMAYDEQQSELSCREDQQRKQKAESIDGGYLLLKQPQQPAFRRPLAQLYPADTSRGCLRQSQKPALLTVHLPSFWKS